MSWRPNSVRTRLTLWYTAILSGVLLVYATGVYVFVRHALYEALDERLWGDIEHCVARTKFDGSVRRLPRNPFRDPGVATRDSLFAIGWRPRRDRGDYHERRAWALWPPEHSPSPPSFYLHAGESRVETVELPVLGVARQLYARPVPRPNSGRELIVVARSEHELRHELDELLMILLVGFPFAVGLAAFGGAFLAGRALAPIGRMVDRAKTITADRLSDRLPVENEDELGSLATVFNATLERLERSFAETRRFTADASHELRTPLAAMRSVGEVGLRESREPAAYREVIGSMLEDVDRLARLVEGLLTLARADASVVVLDKHREDLAELAREVSTFLEPLAADRGQTIAVEVRGNVELDVDRAVLRRALVNLVDNAIKHGNRDSTIHVRVARCDDAIRLEVADEGPGVPEQHREHVFERFYRADPARSRCFGGTGLGLAIARWAVESHGGRIELTDASGSGSVFRAILPLV